MEFIRTAKKVGNSAGVILPKKLLGSEVKVIVLTRPVNISKKVMKVLSSELKNILGICILNKNPVEVLAITTLTKKILHNDKIKIILMPLSTLKKEIKQNKILKEKVLNSETLLNSFLISQIKKEFRKL